MPTATPTNPDQGVDSDLTVHMLGTYSSLRTLMAFVTASFLVTLGLYRELGDDSVKRDSISAYYYHTNEGVLRMKDVFIAALSSLGLLLIAYQGYRDREKWALNAAGVFLIGVVTFPMDPLPEKKIELVNPTFDTSVGPPAPPVPQDQGKPPTTGHAWRHYTCAILFFGCIIYVCLRRSGDTLKLVSERRQNYYRFAYRLTGTLMLAVVVSAPVLHFVFKLTSTIYWVEYTGVLAFVLFWVVKSIELKKTRAETEAGVQLLKATAS